MRDLLAAASKTKTQAKRASATKCRWNAAGRSYAATSQDVNEPVNGRIETPIAQWRVPVSGNAGIGDGMTTVPLLVPLCACASSRGARCPKVAANRQSCRERGALSRMGFSVERNGVGHSGLRPKLPAALFRAVGPSSGSKVRGRRERMTQSTAQQRHGNLSTETCQWHRNARVLGVPSCD